MNMTSCFLLAPLREVVITSVLDEDPLFCDRGYTRHQLFNEPHGQNFLALKFEISHNILFARSFHCLYETFAASAIIQGCLNLFLSFNA